MCKNNARSRRTSKPPLSKFDIYQSRCALVCARSNNRLRALHCCATRRARSAYPLCASSHARTFFPLYLAFPRYISRKISAAPGDEGVEIPIFNGYALCEFPGIHGKIERRAACNLPRYVRSPIGIIINDECRVRVFHPPLFRED